MEAPILVTGALGNVGNEVVKCLLAAGRQVRAADIHEEKLKERSEKNKNDKKGNG